MDSTITKTAEAKTVATVAAATATKMGTSSKNLV